MYSTLINDELLLRPIIYDFPEQFDFAENFTNQFMIGDSLMVVPVVLPLAKYVSKIQVYSFNIVLIEFLHIHSL